MGFLAKAKYFRDLVLKKGSPGHRGGLLSRASEFLKRRAAGSNKSDGLRGRASGFIVEGLDSDKKKSVESDPSPEPEIIPIAGSLDSISDELQKKSLDFTNIIEISKEINATLQINELLSIVLLTCMGQLSVQKAVLCTRDDTGNFVLRIQRGLEKVEESEFVFLKDGSLSNYFKNETYPKLLDELMGMINEKERNLFIDVEAKVIAPLIAKDKVTGFLILGEKYDNTDFNQGDIDFLSALVSMAAIAIENASLYSSLEQKLKQMAALYDISKIINSSGSISEVLRLACETLSTGFFVTKVAFILKYDEEFKISESIGLLPATKELFSIKKDDPLIASILEAGEAVDFPDFLSVEELKNKFCKEDLQSFQSILLIPLLAGGEKIGFLGIFAIDNQKTGSFTKDQKELFSIIASQIAPPILMAEMVEHTKKRISDPFKHYIDILSEKFETALGFELSMGLICIEVSGLDQLTAAMDSSEIEALVESIGAEIRFVVDEKYEVVRTSERSFSIILPGLSLKNQDKIENEIMDSINFKIGKKGLSESLKINSNMIQFPEDFKDPKEFIFQNTNG